MKKLISVSFLIVVIFYLLFTIRPALLGQLNGTLKSHNVPSEYKELEKFLVTQNDFFRTLWIPSVQRFGFSSNAKPAISASILFKTSDYKLLFETIKSKQGEELVKEAAVKYILIPFDSEKEIFINDRKYDNSLYTQTIGELDSISWLRKIKSFGNIISYQVIDPFDHFWSPSGNLKIYYAYKNPSKYELSIKNAKKDDVIIFSEGYSKYWKAINDEFTITSKPYNNTFNSFILPKGGDYNLEVFYEPQKYVDIGLIISLSSVFLFAIVLFFLKS